MMTKKMSQMTETSFRKQLIAMVPVFCSFISGGRPQFERILTDRLAMINVSTTSRFVQKLSGQLNQDINASFRYRLINEVSSFF
jgi:hypothetical protein